MLESQNPGFRVLNLKTRVPKSMQKPGFSGSGSNPGSIPSLSQRYYYFGIGGILFFSYTLTDILCSKSNVFHRLQTLTISHIYAT